MDEFGMENSTGSHFYQQAAFCFFSVILFLGIVFRYLYQNLNFKSKVSKVFNNILKGDNLKKQEKKLFKSDLLNATQYLGASSDISTNKTSKNSKKNKSNKSNQFAAAAAVASTTIIPNKPKKSSTLSPTPSPSLSFPSSSVFATSSSPGTSAASTSAAAAVLESNPCYISSLKGFTREVTAISISLSGKRVVLTSSDSSLLIYFISDPNSYQSLQKIPFQKFSIHADYFTAADISVDENYVYAVTELTCKILKISIPENSSSRSFKQIAESSGPLYKKNSVKRLVSSKGKWVLTMAENEDTELKLFDYSLNQLAVFDTNQVKNFSLGVSPNSGRFFGVAAWMPGVKLMEVKTQKASAEFRKLDKALDLTSSCGITAVAISPDDRRALVACKDGTLLLWNIDVRYQDLEDPQLLLTVKDEVGNTSGKTSFSCFDGSAFSADSKFVILYNNREIKILRSFDLSLVELIDFSSSMSFIRSSVCSPVGNFYIAAGSGKARLWKTPVYC